jgi:PAS domain S-box-containing protein
MMPSDARPGPLPDTDGIVRAIVDASSDAIFAKDADGRMRYVNPAAVALLGKPVERILGHTDFDYLDDPADARAVRENDRRVMEGRRAVEVEEVLPYPDGTSRVWLSQKVPYFDGGGRVVGVLGIARDITERKALEKAKDAAQRELGESREQLRLAIESVGAGVFDWDLQTGRLDWDARTRELLGVSSDEPASIERFMQCLAHDERAFFEAELREALASDADVPWKRSFRVRTAEGASRWIDACGRIRVEPGEDGRPQPVRFAGLLYDVTDQVESAERLAASERARLQTEADHRYVLDRTHAAVVLYDADGAITFSNPVASRLLGLSEDQMLGRVPADPGWHFLRADGSVMPLDEYPVSIVARTCEPLEDYIVGVVQREGMAPIWVLVNAYPEIGPDGRLRRTVVSFVDISRLKHAEERLVDADRRKDEFLAMLAHELRNPLAPIVTAAHLLQRSNADAERVHAAADVIARQAAHITRLVDDLLDVSRVTRGLVQLEREDIDLKPVIAAAVEQVRPLLDTRGHTLSTLIGPGRLRVLGDRVRLAQVVANLLNNAAKYTPPGGRIELAVEAAGRGVRIRVSDDGCGIASDLLPGVFELFTQAARTPDRAQGGLGIGLALVRNIVQLHGGHVSAASAGIGQGSTFEVVLPRLEAPVDPTGAATDPRPGARRDARVLVVDDNADAARTLAELLAVEGHRVVVAVTAAEAIARASTEGPFDVLVVDIGLPDMTGYELVAPLRRHAGGHAVAIALTGYGQPHDRVLSRAAGFDHHLVKPVEPARLFDAVADAVATPSPGAAPCV